jgi:hypothetical protein
VDRRDLLLMNWPDRLSLVPLSCTDSTPTILESVSGMSVETGRQPEPDGDVDSAGLRTPTSCRAQWDPP